MLFTRPVLFTRSVPFTRSVVFTRPAVLLIKSCYDTGSFEKAKESEMITRRDFLAGATAISVAPLITGVPDALPRTV